MDRGGVALSEGGGSLLLNSTGRFVGPGQAGLLSRAGRGPRTEYLMSMHYYDGYDSGRPKLRVMPLTVDADGWLAFLPPRGARSL